MATTYDPTSQRVRLPNGLRVPAASSAAARFARKTGTTVAAIASSPAPAPSAADLYRQNNGDVCVWLDSHAEGNDFAKSLLSWLDSHGTLTDNQAAAVRAKIQHAQAAKTATDVEMLRINEAISRAEAAGLDRIKLRLGEFAFKPAGLTSRNPGAVYVTDEGGEYLGKIIAGKLFALPAVTDEQRAAIARVAADPAAAAIAHGRETGRCACCGLKLTDPESVERGIGPICAEKFGF